MAHLKTELKRYLLLFVNFSWINGILVRNDTKLNYLLNLFDSDFTTVEIWPPNSKKLDKIRSSDPRVPKKPGLFQERGTKIGEKRPIFP